MPLTFDEAVVRFKDNEARLDLFLNDAVGYLTREGAAVESIIAFLDRLETEITAYANLTPRVGTLETEMDAVEADVTTLQGEMTTAEADIDTLQTQMTEAVRKTTTPSEWITYLPTGSDHTTPTLTTLTKVTIPDTVKLSNDFALVDIGGGDMRIQYQGTVSRKFRVQFSSGIRTSTSSEVLKFRMYKGSVGTPDVVEPGVGVEHKTIIGADTHNLHFVGVVTLAPDEVVALAVESSSATAVTFIESSLLIEERNG